MVTKSRSIYKTARRAFPVSLFFFHGSLTLHTRHLGARWWNYYIKLRNRRARSFQLGNILATQWKNHLFRRTVLFMSSPGLWGHLSFFILVSTLLGKFAAKRKCRIMLKKKGVIFSESAASALSTMEWNGHITTGWLPAFTLMRICWLTWYSKLICDVKIKNYNRAVSIGEFIFYKTFIRNTLIVS